MKYQFQSGGKKLHSIPTPVGQMRVPQSEAKRLAELTDEEALAEVHKGPFVDPFALGEVMRRGIYHKLEQPGQQNRMTFGDMLQRIIDEAEDTE